MYDSAVSVNGVKAVVQVLDEQLTKSKDGQKEEEEVSWDKLTFLDALKEPELAWKYIVSFDTENSVIVICIKV